MAPDGQAEVTTVSVAGLALANPFAGITLSWTGPGGYSNTGITLVGLDSGTYFVTAQKTVLSSPGYLCSSAPFRIDVEDERVFPTVGFEVVNYSACDTNLDGQIRVNATTSSTTPGIATSNYDFIWTNDPDGLGPLFSITNDSDIASPYTSRATDLIGGPAQGSGTYSIDVTNRTNHCTTSGDVIVLKNLVPMEILDVDVVDVTFCAPRNGDATVVSVTGPSITPPLPGFTVTDFTFDWDNDPDLLSLLDSNTGASIDQPVLQPLDSGSYYVQGERIPVPTPVLRGVSGSGCLTNIYRYEVIDIHIDPTIAAATINPEINCAGAATGGGQISIAQAVPANFTFNWYAGPNVVGAPFLTGIGANVAPNLEEGEYTLQLIENSTQCGAVQRFTIENEPTIVKIDVAGFTEPSLVNCDRLTGLTIGGIAAVNSINENGSAVGVGAYQFTWTDDVPTILLNGLGLAFSTLNNIDSGTYFVNVVHNVTNCATTYEFEVEDETIGTTTVTVDGFTIPERCVNPTDGSITVSASGTAATYDFEWYDGEQTPLPAGLPDYAVDAAVTTSTLGSLTVVFPATSRFYTVKAINNTNNCWGVEAIELPVEESEVFISASTLPQTSCVEDNGQLLATTTNDFAFNYDFEWSIGKGRKIPADFFNATPVATAPAIGFGPGHYTVIALNKNGNPNCKSDTLSVEIRPDLKIPTVEARMLNPLTFCDPTKPDGVATADVGGDVINYFFDWFGPAPATDSLVRSVQADSLAAGTYTVKAKHVLTGCSDDATVEITEDFIQIPDPTIVILSQVTSCDVNNPNGSLSVSVDGNVKDYVFDWTNGPVPQVPADASGEFYDSIPAGTYSVRATNTINGCSSTDSESLIDDQVLPTIDFVVEEATCGMDDGYLSIKVLNNVELATIEWYFDPQGTNLLVGQGPNLPQAVAGVYQVKVATNLACEGEGTVELKAEILPFNGVSKKLDNKNDKFIIDCIEDFPENRVEIFNRAGTKVFSMDGYDNSAKYFDGRSNEGISIMGTNLPAGTYFYVIDKRNGSGKFVGYLEVVD